MKNKLFFLLAFGFTISCQDQITSLYTPKIIEIEGEVAASIAVEMEKTALAEVHPDFEVNLWASDSLVEDPIAISADPYGNIYFNRAIRINNSEYDIRGYREWMTSSIGFQSVEDRRSFLREKFPVGGGGENDKVKDLNGDGEANYLDLQVEKEEIWRVSDEDGDGYADKSVRYLQDFHEEISDLANGIEYYDGHVYVTCAPDLWKLKDDNGDGIADTKESLAHGFGVHIGFGAHGLSGVTMGPDGRLWWGIGDIGMNVTDKEGKQWKYPNRGVIARCEQDGTGFEVYASGVRNTHEFVFDKYGNLITEDNDGDHPGERERLVYLINGSDTGWRINWQFGKYTDPKNNRYKVWMDEKMAIPSWEGQAAYFLPPITNYVNGPTGMVYNPGTALGPKWYDHFFIAEFRGTPTQSPIHAFTLEPDGASFKLKTTEKVVSGLLPTGLDFSADGALYFGDWIDGWNRKGKGKIWKLDIPSQADSDIRQDTKRKLEADFNPLDLDELKKLLAHQDMRVRQKAQFAIVKREEARSALEDVLQNSENQLARIHALWGLGQMGRKDNSIGEVLLTYVEDADQEVAIQAVKMIGDIKYEGDSQQLLALINAENPRMRLMATEAVGRMEMSDAMTPIIQMVEENNNQDKWLRHAAMIALGRLATEASLAALYNHDSEAVRIAAVVALRRQSSSNIVDFLQDENEAIVLEVARAINDDFSIPEALGDLAAMLETSTIEDEVFLRRVLNAHLRLGEENNLNSLLEYANNKKAPIAMREEALAIISHWHHPSPLDRVDGRFRGTRQKDSSAIASTIDPHLQALLDDRDPRIVSKTTQIIANYGMKNYADQLAKVYNRSRSDELKVTLLQSLAKVEYAGLPTILNKAGKDRSPTVRATAVELVPQMELADDQANAIIQSALKSGDKKVQQSAIKALANYQNKVAEETFSSMIDQLEKGALAQEIELELIEAIEKNENESLSAKLEKLYAGMDDPLAKYRSTLAGGNRWAGRDIFENHSEGECTRCHTVFEFGGDAGPSLVNVGNRLSKRELLESLVYPSQTLAIGYGAASVTLSDGSKVAGIIQSDSADELTLKVGEDVRIIKTSEIDKRENLPSSMPSQAEILSLREMRDLVEYLSTLKEEES